MLNPDGAERFVGVEAALERFGDEKAIVLNLRDGFSDMRDLLGYEDALMAMLLDRAREFAVLRANGMMPGSPMPPISSLLSTM